MTEQFRVVVAPFSGDAAWRSGPRVLVINPDQSFAYAVAAVQRVLPHLEPATVRAIVRKHMPDAICIDDLTAPPADRTVILRTPQSQKRASRPCRMVAIALLSMGIGLLAGRLAVPAAPPQEETPPGHDVFASPQFKEFSRQGGMRCTPLAPMQARCTDTDGMVMLSEAMVGPDNAIFTFSYGGDTLTLRVFDDAVEARIWAEAAPTLRSRDNVHVVSRYVLWGTDEARLSAYADLIQHPEARTRRPNSLPPTASPDALPPRLAVLSLGTLGVTTGRLPKTEKGPLSDAATAVAVRLVLGLPRPQLLPQGSSA